MVVELTDTHAFRVGLRVDCLCRMAPVESSVVRDLEKHVPRILHVTSRPQESAVAGGVSAHHVAESVSSYFSLLRALGAP